MLLHVSVLLVVGRIGHFWVVLRNTTLGVGDTAQNRNKRQAAVIGGGRALLAFMRGAVRIWFALARDQRLPVFDPYLALGELRSVTAPSSTEPILPAGEGRRGFHAVPLESGRAGHQDPAIPLQAGSSK